MKKELKPYINNELIVAKVSNGNITTTVGILVRLRKNAMQVKKENGLDIIKKRMKYVNEFIPYESVLKVSTGQKVLSK